jgi:hypothetical protein
MMPEHDAKRRKKGLWRWLLLVLLLVSALSGCVIAVLWWDNRLYHRQGYSRLTPRPDVPYGPSMRVIRRIAAVSNRRDEAGWTMWRWLSPDELARQTPAIAVPEEQPYREFGIYVLKSEDIGQRFLYSPVKLIDEDRLLQIQHLLPSSFTDEKSMFHARFACIVMLCPLAKRKDADGKYYSSAEYPPSIKKQVPAKAWQEWCLILDDDGEGSARCVNSDIPPVPGCIAYINQMNPEDNRFYYPWELLPALRAIYPDLRIPQEAILSRIE